MVAYLILGELSGCTTHDEISTRSTCNLVGYMGWHMELPIIPPEFELAKVSDPISMPPSEVPTRLACR